jgi:hypothetical protein
MASDCMTARLMLFDKAQANQAQPSVGDAQVTSRPGDGKRTRHDQPAAFETIQLSFQVPIKVFSDAISLSFFQ